MTFQSNPADITINQQLVNDAVADGTLVLVPETDEFAMARNVNATFRLLNKHNRPGYEDPEYVTPEIAGAMKTVLMAVGTDVFNELCCLPPDARGTRPVAKVFRAVIDRRINLVDIQGLVGEHRDTCYRLNLSQVNNVAQ